MVDVGKPTLETELPSNKSSSTISAFRRAGTCRQRVIAGVREHLAALAALVALAINALPKAAAFGTVVVAGHVDLDLSSGPIHNERGRRKPFLEASALRL